MLGMWKGTMRSLKGRGLGFWIILIMVCVSLISIVLWLLGIRVGFFPFLFLFFPFMIPFGNRRSEDIPEGRCPECGSHVDPGDDFCRACGRRL